QRVEFVDRARRGVTRELRMIRDAVWSTFMARQEWPKRREIDIEFSSKGVAVDRTLANDLFIDGVTVSLSLRGLWLTPGTQAEQDRVMRVLTALCDIYLAQPDSNAVRADALHNVSGDVSEDDA